MTLATEETPPIRSTADRPARLGSFAGITIEHPYTLAALSGYSDLGMRMICRSLGACMTRHEVVLDQFIINKGRGPKAGKLLDPVDRPIACQLMGHDPQMMAEAAKTMVDFGYDMVDLNFGCPVKKVVGRCRGGYLLADPVTAIDMVKRVRDAVNVPITVKMRRGSDDSPEAEDRFWEILTASVELGIAAVTVHGRTVKQRYIGKSNWSILRAVKKRFPDLYLFGSGDLFFAEDCLRMLAETGCDGVTIARGAIHNPWIFQECLALERGEELPPTPTLAEQGALFDEQLKLCVMQYGDDRATRQLRKFAIKRAHLHPQATLVHRELVALKSSQHWYEVRDRFFSSDERVTREQARAHLLQQVADEEPSECG